MAELGEFEKDEDNTDARVNRHLVALAKEGEIPVSDIVRSGMGYFFSLTDQEKIVCLPLLNGPFRSEPANFSFPPLG
ncbi:MAG: hypothetical protein N3A57_03290 [Negativicutes bacterium]|nr:hypothetical protein [Negativicutes bacterium]